MSLKIGFTENELSIIQGLADYFKSDYDIKHIITNNIQIVEKQQINKNTEEKKWE